MGRQGSGWVSLVAVVALSFGPGWVIGAAAQAGAGQSAVVSARATGGLLDINTASAAELKKLPGMGDAYAKRVIDGRPYTAKNQLVTRGVLPQAAYDRIRDEIVAHRLVNRTER